MLRTDRINLSWKDRHERKLQKIQESLVSIRKGKEQKIERVKIQERILEEYFENRS
jgi:hypothetical protein